MISKGRRGRKPKNASPKKIFDKYPMFALNIACSPKECEINSGETKTLANLQNWDHIVSGIRLLISQLGESSFETTQTATSPEASAQVLPETPPVTVSSSFLAQFAYQPSAQPLVSHERSNVSTLTRSSSEKDSIQARNPLSDLTNLPESKNENVPPTTTSTRPRILRRSNSGPPFWTKQHARVHRNPESSIKFLQSISCSGSGNHSDFQDDSSAAIPMDYEIESQTEERPPTTLGTVYFN